MSLETRYILAWTDSPPFYTEWEAHFQLEAYSGEVEYMEGAEHPANLQYENGEETIHGHPVMASFCDFNIIEYEDEQYRELMVRTRAAKVIIYKDSAVYWQGWTVARNGNTTYNLGPKEITITAACGLALLKNVELDVSETGGTEPLTKGVNKLYTYFRQALAWIGLENDIYEAINVYAYGTTYTDGTLREHYMDTFAFYDKSSRKYMNLYDILEMILSDPCVGGRIYQRNGNWYMDRATQMADESEEITYRAYDSSFVYTGTTAEVRQKSITTHAGDPMIVPINMSLEKEVDPPYSELTVKTNYVMDNNLIRYPETPDAQVGAHVNYALSVDNDAERVLFVYWDSFGHIHEPAYDGVRYNLGRSNVWNTVQWDLIMGNVFMKVSISGHYRGRICVRLFIDDEGSGKTYVYQRSGDERGGDPLSYPGWYEWDPDTVGDTPAGTGCVIYLESDESEEVEFSETMEVNSFGETYSGEMYLLICPPWKTSEGVPVLRVNIDSLSVQWLEAKTQDNEHAVVSNATEDNVQERELKIYNEPCTKYKYYAGYHIDEINYYLSSPALAYPRLLLYKPDDVYVASRWMYTKYDSDETPQRLEICLAQDIMRYYGAFRYKVHGTFKGYFDVGDVMLYKDRKYLIASLLHDLRYAEVEATLLELSSAEEYLITESGVEVVTESDENIIP